MKPDLTLRQLRAIGSKLEKNRVEPSGDYFVIMSPEVVQDVRHMSVRELYKQKSHNERFKRRYGEYPRDAQARLEYLEGFLLISGAKS